MVLNTCRSRALARSHSLQDIQIRSKTTLADLVTQDSYRRIRFERPFKVASQYNLLEYIRSIQVRHGSKSMTDKEEMEVIADCT